jgi:hypothetical protein
VLQVVKAYCTKGATTATFLGSENVKGDWTWDERLRKNSARLVAWVSVMQGKGTRSQRRGGIFRRR